MHYLWAGRKLAKHVPNLFGENGKWSMEWMLPHRNKKLAKGPTSFKNNRFAHMKSWNKHFDIPDGISNTEQLSSTHFNRIKTRAGHNNRAVRLDHMNLHRIRKSKELVPGMIKAASSISNDFSINDRIMSVLDKSDNLLTMGKSGIFNELKSISALTKEASGYNRWMKKKFNRTTKASKWTTPLLEQIVETRHAAFDSMDSLMFDELQDDTKEVITERNALAIAGEKKQNWEHVLDMAPTDKALNKQFFDVYNKRSELLGDMGLPMDEAEKLSEVKQLYKEGGKASEKEAAKQMQGILFKKDGFDKEVKKLMDATPSMTKHEATKSLYSSAIKDQEKLLVKHGVDIAENVINKELMNKVIGVGMKGLFVADALKMGLELGSYLVESSKVAFESISNKLDYGNSFGEASDVVMTDQAMTENQRALSQINYSHMQGRKFLGKEATIGR